MEENEIVEVGRSEATGRDRLELPASALVIRDRDRAWAEAYDGEDPHGTKSLIIVWRAEDRLVVRTGVRRVLHATAQGERVTVEVQRLFPSGREYVEVDPGTLLIGPNPRKEANLTRDFLENIEEEGVQTAVNADLNDDGQIIVTRGQRRARAAAEKGVSRIPVVIDAVFDGDATDKRVTTLFRQVGENLHRQDMPASDHLDAVQDFLDLHVSAAEMAKRLSVERKVVDASIATLGSEAARAVVVNGELDLLQGGVVAEFDDHPDLQARLLERARHYPHSFDQLAQRFRDDLERERKGREAIAALEAQGVTVIAWPEESTGKSQLRFLADLRPKPTSKPGARLNAKAHATCPGHAATLEEGEERPTFVCTDFRANGHAERNAPAGEVTEPRPAGQLSDAEKIERALTRERNKNMAAANTVRLKWVLENLLTRKSLPKDVPSFVGAVLAEGGRELRKAMEEGHTEAIKWLKINAKGSLGQYGRTGPHPIAARLDNAAPATAMKFLLVMAIAAIEQRMTRSSWRDSSPAMQMYLRRLEKWGFVLSDVQRLVLDGLPGREATVPQIDAAESEPDDELDTEVDGPDDPEVDDTDDADDTEEVDNTDDTDVDES